MGYEFFEGLGYKLRKLGANLEDEDIEALDDDEQFMLEDIVNYEELKGSQIDEVYNYLKNGSYMAFDTTNKWEFREKILSYYLKDKDAASKLIGTLGADMIDEIIDAFLHTEAYYKGYTTLLIVY